MSISVGVVSGVGIKVCFSASVYRFREKTYVQNRGGVMGRYKENMCVGCPPHMGCLGTACPNRNVIVYVCERCGDESTDPEDEGWDMDEELCPECKEVEE